jgi:hypothetical protein
LKDNKTEEHLKHEEKEKEKEIKIEGDDNKQD